MQDHPLPAIAPSASSSNPPTSSRAARANPSTSGLVIAAIGAIAFTCAFLAAASATSPHDLRTAGYLMLIAGMTYTIGALMFPAKEPRMLRVLGGLAMLAGLAYASEGGGIDAIGAAMIGFAVLVAASKHTLVVGRVVGGIAAVVTIAAMNTRGREARDAVTATMYVFALLGTVDAIGLFVRASAIGKRARA